MISVRKANGSSPVTASLSNSSVGSRNLRKGHLGGVIFGCNNSTIKECLFKQLFGLPAQHFSYVKNVDPGLPLFLFNYSDKKLHGIFEAASTGQMNINPYGWTTDGAEKTLYPAQVQVRVRLQCQPLSEEQFKPIIADNYYSLSNFWFELDHAQTSKLISLLSSRVVTPSASVPQNSAAWRTLFRLAPPRNMKEESKNCKPHLKIDSAHSDQSNRKLGSSDVAPCLDRRNLLLEAPSDKLAVENDEKDLILSQLRDLVRSREYKDSISSSCAGDSYHVNDSQFDDKRLVKEQIVLEERNRDSPVSSSDFDPVIARLIREELKGFKEEHIQRMSYMEQRLADAEKEIQLLKEYCRTLESVCCPSTSLVEKTVNESFDELNMDPDDLIFLVGGCDGESWLSSLDSYSPSQDMKKSLSPMNMPRSYASVAMLNGELYIFGGGNGSEWYDTVEAYNLVNDKWTLCAPLNKEKGSLAGATLNEKIFALGGGNGIECFSDVDMFDLDIGRWIPTRSMLQKRFALGAAELNGVLYAVGGYDGKDYLDSAERFDPREHSWTRVGGMKTRRGSHALVVLNEKLYALGGFDGNTMVQSVEIYDPRLDSWMDCASMNQSRGYSAAAVVDNSIYVFGGVEDGDNVVGTVEHYEERQGWRVIKQTAIGKRCFASAIVP